MLRLIRFLLLGASLSLVANSQSKSNPSDRAEKGRAFLGLAPGADPVAAARGQKLFGQNCAFCHGQNATGAEGPDLVRSSVVLHDEHGEKVGQVVTAGRPDRGMPAFPSLTAQQIQDLAAFLHSRVEAAANRWQYKIQNVVTGDPKTGQAFFDARCASCHSSTGDLAHLATKFEPADLQAEFLYPGSAKVPVAATVKTSDGREYKGKLKYIDDFTVSIEDQSGQTQSWPRNSIDLQLNDPLEKHRQLLAVYTNQDMHNVLAYLETLK